MSTLSRPLKNIILFVFSFHTLFLISGMIPQSVTVKPKPVRKVIVQHITLEPKPEAKLLNQTSSYVAEAKPISNSKKTPPKKVVEKKQEEKIAANNPKKEKLFAVAQEKLAKLQKKKSTPPQQKGKVAHSNNGIQQLKIDQLSLDLSDDAHTTYHDILADFLKEQLVLPDIGDVKVKLTLSRLGKVIDLKILSSKNEKNKQYIVEKMSKLKFPPFDEHLKGENVYTVVMTLIN